MPESLFPRVLLTLVLGLLPPLSSLADPEPVAPAPATPAPAAPDRLARALAALNARSIHKQQKAIAALGALATPQADQALLALFDRWQTGELPIALWLDLSEAVAHRNTPLLKSRLLECKQAVASSADPLSRWRECLEGGDAEEGREIFLHKVEAGCVRCHKVGDEGAEIGPELTGLGQRMDRVYILESILDPSAVISPGFDQVLLTLTSGEQISGIVRVETPDCLTLVSVADGKKQQINIPDVTGRTALPSAMPPAFGQILTKRSLRDLVEFIATSR